tara:strand:+ start:701 stop:1093 length:393 start_codon:yes stop_codon:yes gene_type:complete
MAKFVEFNNAGTNGQIDAAHDYVCYPVEAFKGATIVGTTRTQITLYFTAMEGQVEIAANAYPADIHDAILLNITTDTHPTVMKKLLALMHPENNHSGAQLISIADDMNVVYAIPEITSIDSITVQVVAAA